MTTAPAQTTTWHDDLHVDGATYPTRHHAHFDRGDSASHINLATQDLQHLRAIHEAAHAVIAIGGGGHLHYAEIETPDSEAQHGGVTYACGLDDGEVFAAFCGAGERANDRWLREQGLWTPRRAVCVEAGARGDRQTLLRINPHIGFGDKEADYRAVHDIADRAIDRYWSEIATVAEALVQNIRMDGDAIADLIRIPNGPHRAA